MDYLAENTAHVFKFVENIVNLQQIIKQHATQPTLLRPGSPIGDIADGVDHNLANELTDILIEGSPVEIEVSFNESSAFRALRKAGIDYEIVE